MFSLDWYEQPFIFVLSEVTFVKLGCEEFSYKTVTKNAEAVVCKCSSEAVTQRCSVIKVLFINEVAGQCWQLYLQRDPSTGVSCEFCKISKNTFSYRTPQVAASSSSK